MHFVSVSVNVCVCVSVFVSGRLCVPPSAGVSMSEWQLEDEVRELRRGEAASRATIEKVPTPFPSPLH